METLTINRKPISTFFDDYPELFEHVRLRNLIVTGKISKIVNYQGQIRFYLTGDDLPYMLRELS